jgi:hypothetical protein
MIELGKDPVELPALHRAGENALAPKSVYVLKTVAGTLSSQLPAGKKAVLARGSATVELTTRDSMGGKVDQPGTYVTAADMTGLVGTGLPTIRKYRSRDTWNKIWSRGGRRFLLATLVAIMTSIVGAWFLFAGDKGTTSATVATRAQAALEWAAAPADQLAAGADVTAVRRELARREREAARCLQQLRGDDVAGAKVEGVNCAATTPSPVRDKDNEALVTTLLGLVTVLLTLTGLRDKFGFGKDPDQA